MNDDQEERFYRTRDQRSRQYGVEVTLFDKPVRVRIDKRAAESVAGQAMLLLLINQAARLHRQIWLDVPDIPFIAHNAVLHGLPQFRSLGEAARAMLKAIDPFNRTPANPDSIAGQVTIGGAGEGGTFLGLESQVAVLDRRPCSIRGGDYSLGAMMAANLGAWSLFMQAASKKHSPQRVSAWDLTAGEEASLGPEAIAPLAIGRCLMVGAGGVGSCLASQLRLNGVDSEWLVMDRDYSSLHNTNRSTGMLVGDTEWCGQARPKAVVAADQFGASPICCWYDQRDRQQDPYDLVLPLANQRGVREAIGQQGEPVLLHAATSPNFEAQLHRHIPDRDDCITCRLPPTLDSLNFVCGEVQVRPADDEESTDAALPFLSSTAATMLLSALYRLATGEIAEGSFNHWRACFSTLGSIVAKPGRWKCAESCSTSIAASVRAKINPTGKWKSLDTCANP